MSHKEHDNHDERYEANCEECKKLWEQDALNAGIPLSVIRGETKLRDHFSQEYIDMQCGRPSAIEDNHRRKE